MERSQLGTGKDYAVTVDDQDLGAHSERNYADLWTCDRNQLKKRNGITNGVECGRVSAVSRCMSGRNGSQRRVLVKVRLSGRQNFGRGDASQFVNAEDRIFDQIVRTRGTGRDADDDGTTGEPMVSHYFSFFVEVVVSDAGC